MTDTPQMSQKKIRQLYKLLADYAKQLKREQPLAAQVVNMIAGWVLLDFEDKP
jgi:hypothetical protein